MTIPQWPFSRSQPAGYADDDVPNGAQLTQMDEQLSRAANGALWSEVPLIKNFGAAVVSAHASSEIVFDPTTRNWFAFGYDAGGPTPKLFTSQDGGKSWASVSLAAIAFSIRVAAAATDGAGTVAFGFGPLAAKTYKVIWSTDGFATLNNGGIMGSNDTIEVTSLHYSARLGLWLAGRSDGSIFSAVTPGGGWTQRLAANANGARGRFAESGGLLMSIAVSTGGASTTSCYTSTDGVTWTNITTPSISTPAVGAALCFLPNAGLFVIAWGVSAGTGTVLTSPDGVTWTAITNASIPIFPRRAIGYGRMIVLAAEDPTGTFHDVFYSLDQGLSFKRSGSLRLGAGGTLMWNLGLGGDQFMAVSVDGSDNTSVYRGFAGGT